MLELTLRIGFSLLIVLGMLAVLAKLTRRPLRRRAGALTVLTRQQLTRGAAVAVVRVADRALLLGVTDHAVTVLTETDADTFDPTPAPAREPVTIEALPSTIPLALGPMSSGLRSAGSEATGATREDDIQKKPQGPRERMRAPASRASAEDSVRSALAGSVLSPQTWRDTVEFLRERTVRRS